MEVSQKTKNRATLWPSNSTPVYISKETKTLIWKDTCTPMFIAALLTIAKVWKQPKCPPTDEWIKKIKWNNKRKQNEQTKKDQCFDLLLFPADKSLFSVVFYWILDTAIIKVSLYLNGMAEMVEKWLWNG